MVEYLIKKGRRFFCTLSDSPCPYIKNKKEAEEFEGCAGTCDRPINKHYEDKAEMYCRNDYPDPY